MIIKDRQISRSCQRAEIAVEHENNGKINNSWRAKIFLTGLKEA